MKIIIFAGGTGKRFWPVSRKNSPKQFLPIIDNKPLSRLRFDILKNGFDICDIYISTGKRFEAESREIFKELPAENFILEPEMRDTGPAVSLAVSYIANQFPDEVISIQWSDHLIKKPEIFIESLKESERIVKDQNKTVLLAVPARFPSPHRGYIQFSSMLKNINSNISLYNFEKFVEKPTKEIAQQYINSGNYAWNPGYWTITGDYYLEIIKQSAPSTYEVCQKIVKSGFAPSVLEKFRELDKISADYQFAEKISPEDAFVLLTDMGWSDVGEWIAFKEALEESQDANVINGQSFDLDSTDTLVYNTESGKLIATIGLKGMVVVNTPDVLAVFHKDDNTRIKEFLNKIEEEGLDQYL
jgi:mannose-1-phosphate guanylyltransferase